MKTEQFVGWALVHSVWEGAAIAAALAITLMVWRRASADSRYVAALAALLLCLIAPVGTAAWLAHPSSPKAPTATIGTTQKTAGGSDFSPAESSTPVLPEAFAAPASPPPSSLQDKVEVCFPWILRLWLAGMIAMCIRLAGGLFVVERLKRSASERMAQPWSDMAQAVAVRLGIKRRIEFRLCDGIDSPSVIGAIKATVLFPASALLRLTPGQVEALLAHELAHVRRHDYVVNLIQSVIETVLFYHPAVWWVSKVTREEREHCCDDLAIEVIGSKRDYANALASLESCRRGTEGLAMAGSGGSLVGRIRRILNIRPAKRTGWGTVYPASLVLALAITVAISAGLAHSLTRNFQADSGTPITVHGQALDSTGRPVAGAAVFCRRVNSVNPLVIDGNATTNAKGDFEFPVNSADRCEILVAKRGYGYALSRYALAGAIQSVTLRFPVTTSERVVVLDKKGHPMPGLRLRPAMSPHFRDKGLDAFAETTDDKGVAIFPDCPVGSGTMFVSEDPKSAVSLAPRNGADWYLQKGKQGSATLLGEPSATIRGRITMEGRPLAHALAVGYTPTSAYYADAETDSDGNFELTGFPSKRARVQVHLSKALRRDWAAPVLETNMSSGTTAHVDLKLTHGALITGRVSAQDGSPARQVPLMVVEPLTLASEHTDENGNYEIRVPGGRVTLQAGRTLASPPVRFSMPDTGSFKTVDVKDGDRLHVDLTMPPTGVTTKVTVFDASGKPVPNLLVDCGSGNSWSGIMTDANGVATVVMDEANAKKAWFRAAWHGQFSDPKVTPVNGVARIQLHKVNVGSVAGKVVDAAGRPIPNASIMVVYESWGTQLADARELEGIRTSADGTYRIKDLNPGVNLTLLVDDKLHAGARSPDLTVVAGKTVSVPTLTLKPLATISGQIVDGQGKPLAGVKVFADNTTCPGTTTDRQGRFSFPRVPQGKIQLSIYKIGKATRLQTQTGTNKTYTLH